MSTAAVVFIAIPLAVAWIAGVVDIFRHPMPTGQRVFWIVIVIVLPIIGTLAYFILRKPTEREVRAAQAAAAERRRDRRATTAALGARGHSAAPRARAMTLSAFGIHVMQKAERVAALRAL